MSETWLNKPCCDWLTTCNRWSAAACSDEDWLLSAIMFIQKYVHHHFIQDLCESKPQTTIQSGCSWCCMFLTKMTSVTPDTHLRYPGCRARRAGVRLGVRCRWRFPGSRRSSDWPGTHGASGRAVGTSSSPSTNRCECRWRLTARGLAEGGQGWG